MSAEIGSLLTRLAAVGIRLHVEAGDRLRYRAPKGAMTPELAAEIKGYRAALIAHLATASNPTEAISRLPDAPDYALSQAQWRLWVLMEMQRESTAYNVPLHLEFTGPLDATRVEAAFSAIVQRHEALRTNFVTINDEPRQVVHPPAPLLLATTDLSDQPDAVAQARELAREQTARPFDLANDPLVRLHLLRLGPRHHVLLLTLHHIVVDGTSCGILLREFAQFYPTGSVSLAPLALQYRDYAAWQNSRLHHPALVSQGRYWRDRFQGEIPVIDLPADSPRPAVLTHRGRELTFEIDATSTAALQTFCRQGGGTLFMGLLGAVKLLLHRCSGQTDLIVGSPIAGRTHEALQDQVGFYINTLALRTAIDPHGDAQQLLANIRATVTGAFDHQDYPFDFLVNELDLARDQSRSPLFDVMVTLQNQDESGAQIADIEVNSFLEPSNTSKVDLTFYFKPRGDQLQAAIEYNADIYAPDRIERMAGHLQTLIRSMTDNPSEAVGKLAIMPAAEREQILRGSRATAPLILSADTIISRFEAQATKSPDRVALSGPEHLDLTYGELNKRADLLGRQLLTQGVVRDQPVGLLLERSTDLIVAMLGILKAGGAYLPIDPIYPDERIIFILTDAEATVVVTHSNLSPRLVGLTTEPLLVDAPADEIVDVPQPSCPVTPTDAAYIIYTSGSTGTPKGCIIPHQQVVRLFDATAAWFKFGTDDVWTLFHSPAFDFSVWEIWGALLHGGRLVIPRHETTRDPTQFWQLLRDERVTVLNQTPSAFQQLIVADGQQPADQTLLDLRTVIFGGEALDIRSLRAWWARYGDQTPRLVNMYGITETTVHCTYRPLSRSDLPNAERSVIGRAIPDLEIYLLDAQGEPVPVGVPGEIHVGGNGLARGYLNRSELTAERFVPHPFSDQTGDRLYRSGDLARWLPDGDLEYLGRSDDQVKIRGFRIELGEIEAKLTGHPDVASAHVLARRDEDHDQQLIAYFTTKSDSTATSVAALREHLADQLPDYMIPAMFIVLDRFPLTANGKVDRRALPAPSRENQSDRTRQRIAPRNPTEAALVGLWREVLGIDEVGVTDSFFELGGHSLKAVRIVARARQELGCELTMADIFRHPTVAELAAKHPLSKSPREATPRPEPVTPVLSISQRRLWVLEQMRPGTTAFAISSAWKIEGPLDQDRWDQASRDLVTRHEALRARFVARGDEVEPRALPLDHFAAEHLDFSGQSEPFAAATQRLEAIAAEGFDLSSGPLFRLVCARVSAHEHLLLMSMHHIVSDGWSMELIMREFALLYNQDVTPAELPPTTPYAAFAFAQTEVLAGSAGASLRQFWQDKLGSSCESLQLPTDYPRPSLMAATGEVAEFRFSPDVSNALKSWVAAENCTVFIGLVSLVKILLYRYTGQTDLTVGSPVAGREDPAWEHTVGFFINTIVIRDEIDPDANGQQLLRQVRDSALDAFAHQAYPFDQLVDDLQLERDLSRHPLFDVSIQYIPEGDATPRLQGLSVEAHRHHQIPLKCDLSFDFGEDDQGVTCSVTYNAELFAADRIERMSRHLTTLAEALFTQPETALADLPLLDETERRQVRDTFAGGAQRAPIEQSLSAWFDETAEAHADQPALITPDQTLSYADLRRQVNALASRLVARGLQRGDVAGVMLQRGMGLPIAMLAIMRAGAIYLPLDPVLPTARLDYLVQDGRIDLIITEAGLLDRCPSGPSTIVWGEEAITEPSSAELPPFPLPTNPAYLIYTSGSTGQPKGVLVSHAAYGNSARNEVEQLKLQPGERMLQFANPSFDASILEIFGALLSGSALVFAPTDVLTDPVRLPRWLKEQAVTIALLPPSFLRTLNHADLPLRMLLTGGEAAVSEDVHHYAKRLDYVNAYGPTEVAVWNAMERVTADSTPTASTGIPIGRPLPGTQLYIVDENFHPVPIGIDGEICIGGLGLAEGYWQRDELTREAFIPHPFATAADQRLYRTGDMGRWLPDGRVIFIGRRDGQIKLRGHRIETGEIAQVLQSHPDIDEAVVMLRRDAPSHPLLTAYYRRKAATVDAANLQEFLTARLPAYMLPDAWVAVESWPLTPAGKIDRRSLPAPDLSTAAEAYEAPRDEVERLLATIFAEVLSIERVGITDRFFRLGGNSLLSLRAVTRIREALRVELAVPDFFAHASVRELGQLLRADPAQGARVDKVAAARAKLAAMSPEEKQRLLATRSTPAATT